MKKTKEFNIFNYNVILKPFCEHLTHHKHRKLIAWCQGFEDNGYKYPNRYDFWYKCKVCGYVFFNHKISKEDLENIKKHKEVQ